MSGVPARVWVRDAREVLAGCLFLGFAGVGLVLAVGYPTGNAMRMGAGYFPLLVSGALALLGTLILLRGVAFSRERVSVAELFVARPGLSIAGSVLAFALSLPWLGLALATVLMTLLSGLARRRAHLGELALLGCGLGAFSVLVFAYGLGLNLPVWPV